MGKKSEKTIVMDEIRRIWKQRDTDFDNAKTQKEKTRIKNESEEKLGKLWGYIEEINAKKRGKTTKPLKVVKFRRRA